MKADPKTSEGARLERRAMRDYLRRRMKCPECQPFYGFISETLAWVLRRQQRYDGKAGGLGK